MKRFINSALLVLATVSSGFSQATVTPPGSFFMSHDNTKIYYEVAGEGKPVILVHGFVTDSKGWKQTALFNDLQTQGFKVILLDLRGNGNSDKPHEEKYYEHDAEAKDVMALADKLGLGNYDVVGYSRGAIIASRVLVLDKRVTHAVLGGMGSDFMNPEWPRRIMFYEGLSGKKQIKDVEGLINHIKEAGLDQQALALMQYGQPSTSSDEFTKVKTPVLVICGTEDEVNGSSKALADEIPGSSYVRTPGKHNDASKTKQFSSAVIEFLKK
jgi:pimeloyl-ACP methyl ester carboxylesterase